MSQIVRNLHGQTIGRVVQQGLVQVGYHMARGRVGFYDPRLDITFSPAGSRLGYGNLLRALILEIA